MSIKYMVWNNKGGVGKTFLTYALSSAYAQSHPDEDVVIVDLCPQANISEMMLGGNGLGEDNLTKCYNNQTTIASYIKARYDQSRFARLGNELGYFVHIHHYNSSMPTNMYLLPGDIDLDICSSIISYLASAPEKGAWGKSRKILLDLIESIETDRRQKSKKITFFFDCNPSFANYTEMAVVAANRLIIPCTADSASIRGIHNLFRVIYGIEITNQKKLSDGAVFDTFVEKAKDASLTLPKVHMLIQNKSRTNDKNAAAAFKAHMDTILGLAVNTRTKYPQFFAQNDQLIFNIKDGNTLASVANYTGMPIADIQVKKYSIYGKQTQVSAPQKTALLTDITACVAKL